MVGERRGRANSLSNAQEMFGVPVSSPRSGGLHQCGHWGGSGDGGGGDRSGVSEEASCCSLERIVRRILADAGLSPSQQYATQLSSSPSSSCDVARLFGRCPEDDPIVDGSDQVAYQSLVLAINSLRPAQLKRVAPLGKVGEPGKGLWASGEA